MADVPFLTTGFPTTGATTNRTLPDRLQDTINVKDYGAKGDGVTDDWSAIMAALSWNSVFVTAAAPVYAGAVRVATASWSASGGGTVTANTTIAHGLTNADQVFLQNFYAGDGLNGNNQDGSFNGVYSVTVIDSDTFTYGPTGTTTPGTAAADTAGYFTAAITGAAWAANVVTVTYSAPHRLVSGITCTVSGFSSGDGSRVITVGGNPRELTFPLAGGGAITAGATALIQQPAVLQVTVAPPSTIVAQYPQESNPVCNGASYAMQVTGVSGTTITFASGTAPFWADIALNDIIRIGPSNIGDIYFPSGEYHISEALRLPTPNGANGVIRGSGNATIRGNFADFLLSLDQKSVGGAPPLLVKNLSFINDHASGSGLLMNGARVCVKDCSIKVGANGLWTSSSSNYRNAIAFNVEATGCVFRASTGTAAIGINAAVNCMTIRGCYFIGLSEGIRTEDFFFVITGNQFIDCTKGLRLGINPFGTIDASFSNTKSIRGNAFRNCGQAINCYNATTMSLRGNYIVGGASAAYGFNADTGFSSAQIRGMDITGLFSSYAIAPAGVLGTDVATSQWSSLAHRSVRATNSGGLGAWQTVLSQAKLSELLECNKEWVTTYAALPGRYVGSLSYNAGSGVVTLTTESTHAFDHNQIVVSGVTVGGGATSYNGTFTAITQGGGGGFYASVTYSVGSAPGVADANTGIITSASISGTLDAAQGRTRANISDGQKKGGGTANIGDLVASGGSQHVGVRWTQNGWMRTG